MTETLKPNIEQRQSTYETSVDAQTATALVESVYSSIHQHIETTRPVVSEVSRRYFLKAGGVLAAGAAIGFPSSVQASEKTPKVGNENVTAIETADIHESTVQVMDHLGFGLAEVNGGKGEAKTLFLPNDARIVNILEESYSQADQLEGDELNDRIIDDHIRLIETVEQIAEEKGLSLSKDMIMDIAGTAVASWGIKNVLDKNINGLTRGDYLRMSTFTAMAYAVGDEFRRTQLLHNIEETAVAVLTIGAITEGSDFVELAKKDIIKSFMDIAADSPGVSDGELSEFLTKVQIEDPERYQRIVNSIETFEHHTLQDELAELGYEDADMASFIKDISSGKLENMSRTEALRFLIVASNTLGPAFTTLVSTSLLTPICRAIARDNGGFDPEVMSALQGYIPNNFGISGFGFIPGFYKTLDNTVGKIPIFGATTLGADFGPRLALKQKAGDHGIDLVSQLDKANVFSQGGLIGGFSIEMAAQIARLEGRSTADVLKELADPRKVADVTKVFKSYGLTSNIKDALLGRFARTGSHLYQAMNLQPEHQHARHWEHKQAASGMRQFGENLKGKFQQYEGGKLVSKGLKRMKNVFSAHGWEHSIGPELTDILRTLPFQSLSVPYVEGVGKGMIDVMGGALEKVPGLKDNQAMRDEVIDFIACQIFGTMSTSFDNFAACKAGVTVLIDRIKEQAHAGQLNMENIGQRVSGAVKKMYDSTVIDGGALPLGNMPNFKMFPLSLYSVGDALPKMPKRMGVSLVAYAGAALAQHAHLLPEVPLEWFESEAH